MTIDVHPPTVGQMSGVIRQAPPVFGDGLVYSKNFHLKIKQMAR